MALDLRRGGGGQLDHHKAERRPAPPPPWCCHHRGQPAPARTGAAAAMLWPACCLTRPTRWCGCPQTRVGAVFHPSFHQWPAFYELWARWGPAGDRDFGRARRTAVITLREGGPSCNRPDTARFSFDGSQRGGGRGGGGFAPRGGPRFDYGCLPHRRQLVGRLAGRADRHERESSDKPQALL